MKNVSQNIANRLERAPPWHEPRVTVFSEGSFVKVKFKEQRLLLEECVIHDCS